MYKRKTMPNTCLCQFVQVEQIPSPNTRENQWYLSECQSRGGQSRMYVKGLRGLTSAGAASAYERANAWVVYLAECEARLRTTVKEVPMSYGAEGETKASMYAPSRIENRAPRASPPAGGAPSNSLHSRNSLSSRHHLKRSPMRHPPPSLLSSSLG